MPEIRYVLMDIEGTTTAIDFVHKTLFPYAARHLARFVTEHGGEPRVAACLAEVKATVRDQEGRAIDDREAVAVLLRWIDEDRKHGALKSLQGMIWRQGYLDGDYVAHVYADVAPALAAWKRRGLILAIYSSGSIEAQKLLFAHTGAGDLTPLISHYFDTTSGPKRERESYLHIARDLAAAPGEILFLSDVAEELDAALAAGMATTQLLRPGTPVGSGHPTAADFSQIRL